MNVTYRRNCIPLYIMAFRWWESSGANVICGPYNGGKKRRSKGSSGASSAAGGRLCREQMRWQSRMDVHLLPGFRKDSWWTAEQCYTVMQQKNSLLLWHLEKEPENTRKSLAGFWNLSHHPGAAASGRQRAFWAVVRVGNKQGLKLISKQLSVEIIFSFTSLSWVKIN